MEGTTVKCMYLLLGIPAEKTEIFSLIFRAQSVVSLLAGLKVI